MKTADQKKKVGTWLLALIAGLVTGFVISELLWHFFHWSLFR